MSTPLPTLHRKALAKLIVASFKKNGPAANDGAKTNNQGDSSNDRC